MMPESDHDTLPDSLSPMGAWREAREQFRQELLAADDGDDRMAGEQAVRDWLAYIGMKDPKRVIWLSSPAAEIPEERRNFRRWRGVYYRHRHSDTDLWTFWTWGLGIILGLIAASHTPQFFGYGWNTLVPAYVDAIMLTTAVFLVLIPLNATIFAVNHVFNPMEAKGEFYGGWLGGWPGDRNDILTVSTVGEDVRKDYSILDDCLDRLFDGAVCRLVGNPGSKRLQLPDSAPHWSAYPYLLRPRLHTARYLIDRTKDDPGVLLRNGVRILERCAGVFAVALQGDTLYLCEPPAAVEITRDEQHLKLTFRDGATFEVTLGKNPGDTELALSGGATSLAEDCDKRRIRGWLDEIETDGLAIFCRKHGFVILDEDSRYGTLLGRRRFPWQDAVAAFLLVTDGTPDPAGKHRRHLLRTAPNLEPLDKNEMFSAGSGQRLTARNAAGSLRGMTGHDYADAIRVRS